MIPVKACSAELEGSVKWIKVVVRGASVEAKIIVKDIKAKFVDRIVRCTQAIASCTEFHVWKSQDWEWIIQVEDAGLTRQVHLFNISQQIAIKEINFIFSQ